MPRGRQPENVSPYTGLRVSVCKVTYTQEGEKLPTGGGEWPTFRTAHGTPPYIQHRGGMFARRATFLLTIPTSAPDLPSHEEAPQAAHVALHTFPTKHVA